MKHTKREMNLIKFNFLWGCLFKMARVLNVAAINATFRRELLQKINVTGAYFLVTISNGAILEIGGKLLVIAPSFWETLLDEYKWLTTIAKYGNSLYFWHRYKKTRFAYFFYFYNFDSEVRYPGFVLNYLKKRCHLLY